MIRPNVPSVPPATAPLVLVVDDNADGRDLVVYLLEREGYRVIDAPLGAAAIECARRTPPDAVVMDLHMPDMDGVTATRHIRALPGLAAVPVIAHTARPELPPEVAALFTSICPKPCNAPQLVDLVRQAITAQ